MIRYLGFQMLDIVRDFFVEFRSHTEAVSSLSCWFNIFLCISSVGSRSYLVRHVGE